MKHHLQCATDPRPFRAWSDHDPTMIRPWNRQSATRLAPEVTFYAYHDHFVLKNARFCAPAIITNFTKYCACHEKWEFNFTKCCTCHEKWQSVQLHQMLRLPRKVTAQLHQMLRWQKVTLELHQMLRLPGKVTWLFYYLTLQLLSWRWLCYLCLDDFYYDAIT